MKSNYILLILVFFALTVSSCKRNRVYSEENETNPRDNYEEIEFHQGSDGFKWYSARKDGKVVALDSNMNEIIKPFDGRIDYRSEDSRFLKIRDYYTSDSTNKITCVGLYSQKGIPIIHEANAYSVINIKHFYNIDKLFYETGIWKDGKLYYGLLNSDGSTILDVYSSSPIVYENKRAYSNEYEDGIAPMFLAKVDGNPYYTFRYINDNNEIKSYGGSITIKNIYIRLEYSETYGWQQSMKGGFFAGLAYFVNKCLFITKSSHEREYYKYDYIGIEDEWEVYRNNKGNEVRVSFDNMEFYPPILCGGKKYTFYTKPYDNSRSSKICQDLYEYRSKFVSQLNNGDIDGCYQLQNSHKSNNGDSYQSYQSGNPSFNTIVANEPIYQEETTELYEEQETRQPIRNRCQACHKNPGSCSVCNGSRKVEYRYISSTGEWIMKDCPTCHGSGICQACKGDGWIDEGVDF